VDVPFGSAIGRLFTPTGGFGTMTPPEELLKPPFAECYECERQTQHFCDYCATCLLCCDCDDDDDEEEEEDEEDDGDTA
jgi:hypothetical protein